MTSCELAVQGVSSGHALADSSFGEAPSTLQGEPPSVQLKYSPWTVLPDELAHLGDCKSEALAFRGDEQVGESYQAYFAPLDTNRKISWRGAVVT